LTRTTGTKVLFGVEELPRWRAAVCWLASQEWFFLGLAAPVLFLAPPWAPLALLPLAVPLLSRLVGCRYLTRCSPLNGPVLLILLLGVMATFVSADRALSWPKLWGMVLQAAVYFVALNWLTTIARLRQGAAWLVALPTAVALVGLLGTDWSLVRLLPGIELYEALPRLDLLARLPDNGLPSSAPLFHPREVGITLGFLLPLPLAMLFFGHGRRGRLLAALAALPALLILALTQALSGFLALAAALALFAVAWRRWVIVPLALAAGGLAALLIVDPLRLAGALLDIDHWLGVGFVLRFDMWSRALAMIGDMPLTGVGLNGYPLILSHFYPGYLLGPEPHAHNLLLQTAVDVGLPGLLALAWLFVSFFTVLALAARRSTEPWQRALLLGLAGVALAYIASGLLDVVTLGGKPLVTLWLLLGAGAAAGRLLSGDTAQEAPKTWRARLWRAVGAGTVALTVLALTLLPGVLAGNLGAVRGHRVLVAARETGRLPAMEAEAAVMALEEALAHRPDDPDLHHLLGSLAAWQGEYAMALVRLERRVERDGPQALDTYVPFTRWQRALAGEPPPPPWESTARLYTQWMNRYPARAEETMLLVLVRERQGQPEAAARLIEAARARGAEPAGLLDGYEVAP